MIFFFDPSHHNWLQDIEEDVNLNVVCTKYRQGNHKFYRGIIPKIKNKAKMTNIISIFTADYMQRVDSANHSNEYQNCD